MSTIKFALVTEISYRDWMAIKRTPSEWGILSYLRLRQLEGKGPATREEILIDSGLSEKTVDTALRTLRKQGSVERKETYEATAWSNKVG